MIAKGNPHGDGGLLAAYLMTAKNKERVELVELRGFFGASDIHDAFLQEDLDAREATRCENPFFHVQVRNPEGERLSPDQWLKVADRIEASLGFEDQPRAMVMHDDHMHIAWSRLDAENMVALDPGLYKNKLKATCRELETELGLTQVRNERLPEHKTLSASRDEFEEARRLGTDLKEIRETIRDCWERSDNGHSFAAALEHEGLTLAQGDRRDFVVIDHERGLHALGKRITGDSAKDIRECLADLDRAALPSVEQAREQQLERGLALAEKTLEQSAERRTPERIAPEAEAVHAPAREEKPLGRSAGEIHLAYSLSDSAQSFAEALQERGLRLARVSAQDVTQNEQLREEAKAHDRKAPPRLTPDELVIVSLYKDEPEIYFLNQRTTGESREEIAKYLATFNHGNLPDITGAAHEMREAAARQAELKTAAQELGKVAGEIRLAYTLSQSGQEFVDGLEERGLRLARVNLSDVQQNAYAREYCAEQGKRPPTELQLDEVVAVNRYGAVYFLNERTTGESREETAQYLGAVSRDLPSMQKIRDDFIRQAEFVPDPELQHKDRDELRELRTELTVLRRELREQLGNEELSPTERAELQAQDAELREQQGQVRHALWEKYVAEPSRFMPEAREIRRETPTEELASSFKDAAHEAVDLVGGLADMAGKAVEFIVDFFLTPSLPTPEVIHARREAREEKAELMDARRYDTDRAYRELVNEQDRMRRQQEAEREYMQKQERELHPKERERER